MIRETRFLISRRPYAVNLATLRITERHGQAGPYYDCRARAVWFRRRNGVTAACAGVLWDFQREKPADATAFLTHHDDGRYGGDCDGRWDGDRYWGAQKPDAIQRHLDLLRPMLDAYHAIPDGYDGWWRF